MYDRCVGRALRDQKATKSVKLAAASGSLMHVKGDAKLEFVRNGKRCNMMFLDADVKRPLASVSAIVDGGNVVVFGPQDSSIENTSTCLRIPMGKRNDVFVMQLKTSECESDEDGCKPKMNLVFRRLA